jgi:hypothetical protein
LSLGKDFDVAKMNDEDSSYTGNPWLIKSGLGVQSLYVRPDSMRLAEHMTALAKEMNRMLDFVLNLQGAINGLKNAIDELTGLHMSLLNHRQGTDPQHFNDLKASVEAITKVAQDTIVATKAVIGG